MDKFNEELFEMVGRCRRAGDGFRAASVVGKEYQMIVSNNPSQSNAASVNAIRVNKANSLQTF